MFAGQAGPEDGGDVGGIVPGVYEDGADGVDDDDGVVAVCGYGFDELVAVFPDGEVVAVAGVVVDGDVALFGKSVFCCLSYYVE